MTHPNRSQKDKAEQLDQALDALLRGDHSGLDTLPPEMTATISRLFWLAQEGDVVGKPEQVDFIPDRPATPPILPSRVPTGDSSHAHDSGDARESIPMSARTRKAIGFGRPEPATTSRLSSAHRQRFSAAHTLLRVAAIALVLIIAGGSIYGVITIREERLDQTGSGATVDIRPHQLLPGRCTAEPLDREHTLLILRDVDVDRDRSLRQSIDLKPVELNDGEVNRFEHLFVIWQACRRFGYTYEAMALQSPSFTREDFYGENSPGRSGPVGTAYSDSALNEMLDRREEADTTSRQYWENVGSLPGVEETLLLRGEAFATDDGHFVAIRAVTFDENTAQGVPTTTVVVYQFLNEQYVLFDIQSIPFGMPPSVSGTP